MNFGNSNVTPAKGDVWQGANICLPVFEGGGERAGRRGNSTLTTVSVCRNGCMTSGKKREGEEVWPF